MLYTIYRIDNIQYYCIPDVSNVQTGWVQHIFFFMLSKLEESLNKGEDKFDDKWILLSGKDI